MAKKTKKGVHEGNAIDFMEDLHALLKKYDVKHSKKPLKLEAGKFVIYTDQALVCKPPCVLRHEVIKSPDGTFYLRPYCDCP
jgi:hypothetical protein